MRPPKLLAKIIGFSSKDKHRLLISAPTDLSAVGKSDYVNYKVHFIHQQHVNMCGDACVNMLLSFCGKPHSLRLKNNRGIFDGMLYGDITERLEREGLKPAIAPANAGLTERAFGELLSRGSPLICPAYTNSYTGHWVLVIGKHQDKIIFHDPWKGPNTILPFTEFRKRLLYSGGAEYIIFATNLQ